MFGYGEKLIPLLIPFAGFVGHHTWHFSTKVTNLSMIKKNKEIDGNQDETKQYPFPSLLSSDSLFLCSFFCCELQRRTGGRRHWKIRIPWWFLLWNIHFFLSSIYVFFSSSFAFFEVVFLSFYLYLSSIFFLRLWRRLKEHIIRMARVSATGMFSLIPKVMINSLKC